VRGGGLERLRQHPLVRPLLLPPWFLYLLATSLRNACFDFRLRRPRRLPVPVIGVGNLTVGGTGKSPLVEAVGRILLELGRRPAVISRGYRAGRDGRNDEAAASALPVFCDPHRLRAGRAAIAGGADCLIGDDLFQHRQLHRDCDLVCIDATRPWGEALPERGQPRAGRLLPLGLLRESRAGLRRAQALILTRSDQVPPAALATLLAGLQHYRLPVFCASHAATALRRADGQAFPPDHLRGCEVVLASGIGNPAAFATTARSCGLTPAVQHSFPDHHHFTAAELAALLAEAGERPLVITGKDAVKLLPLLADEQRQRCWILEVELRLAEDGPERLRELLRRQLRLP
jgi:tetraacyldisaccharide 4'-kinase